MRKTDARGRFPVRGGATTRRAGAIAAGALLGVTATFAAYSLAETRRLHVLECEFRSPRLPEAFDGVRVLFASDIHTGPHFSAKRVHALVSTINVLSPDLVLLGGDYVGGFQRGAIEFYPEIARVKPRLGAFAVLGNHDIQEGASEARLGLGRAGFTTLENASARVAIGDDASIVVGGLEDFWLGHPDGTATARGLSRSDFAILVSHNPDALVDALTEAPMGTWDLALAGHTHGGQVTWFGRYGHTSSIYGQTFRTGWSEVSGTPVLVSNGIGTSTVPIRFMARPQLHVITLRHAEKVDAAGAGRSEERVAGSLGR